MKLSDVSKEDGLAIAHLLNTIKVARFDNLTGEDIDRLVSAKKWLYGLATEMASQLKASGALKSSDSKTPVADQKAGGFKVKAMGPLPGKLKISKPKKKK